MRWHESIAVALAAVALTALPAVAQEVGTATAVNPLTESTPPGATTTTLNVGSHIVHNERIHTTPTGSVQLLFTDHSTMSISANSDIVIDEYVYDPNSNSGHMLATISQGALRYVGGKLSHAGQATIETPVATIGIRGAVATIMQVRGGWQITDNYGLLTIQNNAGTTYLKRAGFSSLVTGQNTSPGPATQVTADVTDHQIKIMTSGPGQNGGVAGLKTVTVTACGINPQPGTVCPDPGWINTDAGETDASTIIDQATHHGTSRMNVPPPTIIRGR
jgi:hypothetical protein